MVARRRPAVRKRRMRDRPPGADQLVPDLSGKPEVGVAVVVDVPDLGSSFLGISVPVAGDADPTRTVLISLLEDSIPAQDLALYLCQSFIVHPILSSRGSHCALTSCYGMDTRTSSGWTVYGLNLCTVFAAANLIRTNPCTPSVLTGQVCQGLWRSSVRGLPAPDAFARIRTMAASAPRTASAAPAQNANLNPSTRAASEGCTILTATESVRAAESGTSNARPST